MGNERLRNGPEVRVAGSNDLSSKLVEVDCRLDAPRSPVDGRRLVLKTSSAIADGRIVN